MLKRKKKTSPNKKISNKNKKNQQLNLEFDNSEKGNRALPLSQQAALHLQKNRFRDAVDNFKRLLKQEPDNDAYKQGLLSSYQGRCLQLVDKGMLKEACVIWENRHRFLLQNEQNSQDILQQLLSDKETPDYGQYIHWLLMSGSLKKALISYLQYEQAIAEQAYFPVVQEQIAAHLLVSQKQIIDIIDVNHPLRCHLIDAKQALKAYCEQQPEQMHLLLKKIPFRSAFKNFSLILKAMSLVSQYSDTQNDEIHTDLDSLCLDNALSIFEKIPENSAFYKLKQELVSLSLCDDLLVQGMLKADTQTTLLLAECLGWDAVKLKAWNRAKKLYEGPKQNKQEQLKWLLSTDLSKNDAHKEAILKEIVQAAIAHEPYELERYQQRFEPFDKKEKGRLLAFQSERHLDSEYAFHGWETFLEESTNPLEKALVYRKMAEIADRCEPEDRQYPPQYYWQQSLQYDPMDKISYLRLVDIYNGILSKKGPDKLNSKERKAYQQIVNNAVKHFPADREILLVAIKESQQRKVFKKAAALSRQLLKIDPINPYARQMLVSSHLAHARKNIIKNQYHLAEKEVLSANAVDPLSARVYFFKAVLGFVQEEAIEINQEWVKKGFTQLDNPLLSQLILNTELQVVNSTENAGSLLVRGLKGINECSRSAEELIAEVFVQVQAYQDDGIAEISDAFVKCEKLFKDLSKKVQNKEERIKIAGLLLQYQFYPLAKWFARSDKPLFDKIPLMQYYYVMAESEECLENIDENQFECLEEALEQAKDYGEDDTAALILKRLGDIEKVRFSMPFMGYDGSDEEFAPSALFHMMDEMLENMSPNEKKKLMDLMNREFDEGNF